MADQPEKGGRCRPKKRKTRPKKRSMALRLPNSSLVQVGGKQERFFCRLGFQGMIATACRVARHQARMGALSMIRSRAPIRRRRMATRTLNTKSASGKGAPAWCPRFHCCEALTQHSHAFSLVHIQGFTARKA